MTTNERMNAGRYKHFTRNRQGHVISPFNKGMVNNIADVTGNIDSSFKNNRLDKK